MSSTRPALVLASANPGKVAELADLLAEHYQVLARPDDLADTIEDGQTYEASKKSATGDAVRELRRFLKVLDGDAPKAKKVEALKWVVHLVGDLHQPLHVGRGADRGGNKIEVTWFGKPSNLHKVWDDGLIDPVHTRDALGLCLSLAARQDEPAPGPGIVYRM